MKLIEFSVKKNGWEIDNISFDTVNLIVAKNATGKSTTHRAIFHIVNLIKDDPMMIQVFHGRAELILKRDDNALYQYKFEFDNNNCVYEQLIANNVKVLERSSQGTAMLYGINNPNGIEVFPPKEKLALHTNRDTKNYPFFEEVITWAKSSHEYLFSSVHPRFRPSLEREFRDRMGREDIPMMFMKLDDSGRERVLQQFNSTGYQIASIRAETIGNDDVLKINEQGSDKEIRHADMSDGMFRNLALIIFLEFLIAQRAPTLVLIDDLCEGLDYERATKLGKLVFDKCIDSNIQLIATSNDSFLMDVVDIKYWNILNRDSNHVTAINIRNSPKLFQDFRLTGLSNFDLFSSDFIANGGKW